MLGDGGELAQLAHHEVDDVLRIVPEADPFGIPPPPALRQAREQAILVECHQQLQQEEGVASRLLMHQGRQGVHHLPARSRERVSHQLLHLCHAQRL